MASVSKREILTSTALTDSYTTPAVSVDLLDCEFLAVLTASAIHADTTLDAKLQHSPDGGTNWEDLVSFTQVTDTSAFEVKDITSKILPTVRAVVTLAGSTTEATVAIDLFNDRKK